MKTEDIDKKIGMPDVDAEWAKFEREVITPSKDSKTSHRSVMLWGLSIAASIALVAGIFLFGHDDNTQTDITAAMVKDQQSTTNSQQPATPASQEEEVTTTTEEEPTPSIEHHPDANLLAMATPSKQEKKVEDNNMAVEKAVKEEVVFNCVEKGPIFPGGDKALLEFIKTNMKYPDLAMEYGARGRVVMSFIVDSLGWVSDFKEQRYMLSYDTLRLSRETNDRQKQIKDQIALQLGEESTRILNLMPRWSPGKINGKTTNMKYTIHFRYDASEDERQAYFTQKQKTN